VLELLENGLDVYTTVNIQHLESLKDVVARITSVQVRETIPDSILDEADDIELIDITPDDLIQRLKEGKVYVPQTAERALANFFSPGNLTALRELALRRAAQRVDEQLVTHMRANAISGPWAAGERLLVCIDEGEDGAILVRYGRRMASRLRTPWSAMHIETGRKGLVDEAARDRVAKTMRYAERMGAEPIYVPGLEPASEIIRYASENNITHVVVGKPRRPGWMEFLFPSLPGELIKRTDELIVHVVPLQARRVRGRLLTPKDFTGPGVWGAYLVSAVFTAISLGVAELFNQFLDVRSVALFFIVAVLFSAVRFGLVPSLLSALLGALCFNFFFLPPLYTFTIGDPESIIAFIVFIVVAVIASNLTSNVRSQAMTAKNRARTTEDLFLFSRKLAGAALLDDVLWATAFQIARTVKVNAVILLANENELTLRAGYPPEDMLDEADMGAAKWAWKNEREAGRGSDTLPGARRLFLPLRTSRGLAGVVGINTDDAERRLSPEERRILESLLDQAAVAIERVTLAEEMDRAKLSAESDRLRGALLTSISQDLKAPLASIMGAARTLRDVDQDLSQGDRRQLLQSIYDQSGRLHGFIDNLLTLAKLEAGALAPNCRAYDLREAIRDARQRCGGALGHRTITLDMPDDLPAVLIDPALFEQVLVNLLENATRSSPENSDILIRARMVDASVTLQIMDEGTAIFEGDMDHVFDKYHRAEQQNSGSGGPSLELPVCRGFVEALGGTIQAANRTDRKGAVFTVRIPAAFRDEVNLHEPEVPRVSTSSASS
jgi:two-component system sensor histidine kinase KdpD